VKFDLENSSVSDNEYYYVPLGDVTVGAGNRVTSQVSHIRSRILRYESESGMESRCHARGSSGFPLLAFSAGRIIES